MTTLRAIVADILASEQAAGRPLGVIVAGHNGSGKSSMWHDALSPVLRMPLVNADRMMMSILPEPLDGHLTPWAAELRDTHPGWLRVAQLGVEAFVNHAMQQRLSFAMETVFSHWKPLGDGRFESKIDRILELQQAGYFVLLCFVGLGSAEMSISRVATRVAKGGHGIPAARLRERFPRTQQAIRAARAVADATVLLDNSRGLDQAFTLCRAEYKAREIFDLRAASAPPAAVISAWLDIVAPRG